MKTSRIILPTTIALIGAATAIFTSTAQSPVSPLGNGALGKYEQLISSLSQRGESNTVAQVVNLVSTMQAERDATEVSFTVAVLNKFRSGHTNDALRLLETRLDGAVMSFAPSTRSQRDTNYDEILKKAKAYRAAYPHKSGHPEIDSGVAQTFDSLPK